ERAFVLLYHTPEIPASCSGACVKRPTESRLHPFPTTYAEKYENGAKRDCCARFGKQLAIPDIERQLVLGRHFDLAGKHALRKRAARIIPELLRDTAKLVDETGHPSIRGADHRPTRFYAAKNCIRQVLMRSSGPLKPPVVRHIYEQIRAGTC